ncbi:hypothetical protein Dsin_001590 [Dipteronia sinensis]|uniref:Reverse transcriptase domain-containing protein n=1 Tax=Dipteronia sinensis TaxID=43782 RepID=A0AAE0B5N9_9ROSI|nr:hypothetical protein Dsin_001590 [Dipteronia sinensis]
MAGGEGFDEKCKERYFKNRFMKEAWCQPKINNINLKCISVSDRQTLEEDFGEEEVLAKVFVTLLKKVTSNIIGDSQMAFVKGGQITDSFIVASEIINKWKRDAEGGFLVRLDFEKA